MLWNVIFFILVVERERINEFSRRNPETFLALLNRDESLEIDGHVLFEPDLALNSGGLWVVRVGELANSEQNELFALVQDENFVVIEVGRNEVSVAEILFEWCSIWVPQINYDQLSLSHHNVDVLS